MMSSAEVKMTLLPLIRCLFVLSTVFNLTLTSTEACQLTVLNGSTAPLSLVHRDLQDTYCFMIDSGSDDLGLALDFQKPSSCCDDATVYNAPDRDTFTPNPRYLLYKFSKKEIPRTELVYPARYLMIVLQKKIGENVQGWDIQARALTVESSPPHWTCNPVFYNRGNDVCDCNCGIVDPDCYADNTVRRCGGREYGSFYTAVAPVTMTCNLKSNECETNFSLEMERVCRQELNREYNSSTKQCGACLPSYRAVVPKGKCTVTSPVPLYDYVQVDGEENPFYQFNHASKRYKPESHVVLVDLFNDDGIPEAVLGYGGKGGRLRLLVLDGTQFIVPEPNFFRDFKLPEDPRTGFADCDGDGDLDMAIGFDNGSFQYFENVGNKTHASFEKPTSYNPFEGIRVRGKATSVAFVFNYTTQLYDIFSATGTGHAALLVNIGNKTRPLFHDAKTDPIGTEPNAVVNDKGDNDGLLAIADLDGDGLNNDFFMGTHDGDFVYYRNDTDQKDKSPRYTKVEGIGNPLDGIDVGGYSTPFFYDFNKDGRQDLFSGNQIGFPISYFKAVPKPRKPSQFVQVVSPTFNPLHGKVVGTWAKIAFADLHNSGVLSAYLGSRTNSILYVKNIGTAGFPMFVQVDGAENPFYNIPMGDANKLYRNVAFVDLNADRLTDAVISTSDGELYLLMNRGTPEKPIFEYVELEDSPLGFIDVGKQSYTSFIDIDRDGDQDCFVGTFRGTINFFKNVGNATHANFTKADEENPFASVDYDRSTITFADIENTGFPNAFVGDYQGFIRMFRNEGAPVGVVPNFTLIEDETSPFFDVSLGQRSQLACADMDGDGDVDCFGANYGGVISYFQNTHKECFNDCTFGRGICGAKGSTLTDLLFESIGFSQLGVVSGGGGAGRCLCGPKYSGGNCEICGEVTYGVKCENSCPPRSRQTRRVVYPGVTTIEDCECLPSFVRVNDTCVCRPGTFYDPETITCVACAVGLFNNQSDLSTTCVPCSTLLGPKGTTLFEGSTSSSDCRCSETFEVGPAGQCVCGLNRYGDNFCNECPPLTPFTIGVGKEEPHQCVAGPGSFLTSSRGVPVSCDDAMFKGKVECNGIGISLETLPLNVGFWRVGNKSVDIRSCPKKEYCQPTNSSRRRRLAVEEATTDLYCAPYHEGVMCTSCEKDTAMKGNNCQPCSDEDKAQAETLYYVAAVFVSLLISIPALIILCTKRTKEVPANSNQPSKCTGWWCFETCTRVLRNRTGFWEYMSCKTRIYLGFLQVYLILLRFVLPGYESATSGYSSTTSFFDVVVSFDMGVITDWFDISCYWKIDLNDKLIIHTAAPLISFALMALALLIRLHPIVAKRFFQMVFYIMFLIYPGVAFAISSSFLYESFPRYEGDETPLRALRKDYSIVYDPDVAPIYALVMIVVYPVGILVVFIVGTWFYETYRRDHRISFRDLQEPKSYHESIARSVLFLVWPYRAGRHWFECYELLRKLALTSLFLLIYQENAAGGQIYFVVMCVLFYILLGKIKPYVSESDSMLAEVSLFLLFVLGIVASLRTFFPDVSTTVVDALAITTVCVETLVFLGFAIFYVWKIKSSFSEQSGEMRTNEEEEMPKHEIIQEVNEYSNDESAVSMQKYRMKLEQRRMKDAASSSNEVVQEDAVDSSTLSLTKHTQGDTRLAVL